MARRGAWLTGGLLAVGVGLMWAERAGPPNERPPPAGPPHVTEAVPVPDTAQPDAADDGRSHEFRLPSGRAPTLSCEAARAIVAEARGQLAHEPDPVDPRALAEAAADWLDPYGLWSVAPDTPVAAAFARRASQLLADLEGRGSRDCASARALGGDLLAWVGELRRVFDEARAAPPLPGDDGIAAVFEGALVTRPARVLAQTLGRRIASIDRDLGSAADPYVAEARARYFPTLDADGWAQVVLAAAVRAYVPVMDPHGAWAPLDEESSVYEVDLEAHPPSRLWDKAERTALGVRIDAGAAPPLADGDVLLSLAGVATGGLSYEQTEQLGFAAADARPPAQAVVLRAGDKIPITTTLDGAALEAKASGTTTDDDADLPIDRVEYGDGDVIVVAIHDVRDDLGDQLTRAILREREGKARAALGVVLDLRGNGGGSTDGAIDALGLFIPGAALFPMKRRDGSLETDRAPEPPGVDRWSGPVGALVDGETASAAEMIAGALGAYHRGPIVGAPTFGKGCAQEYIDDDVHAGVLRLTTLVYALPDGAAVQRVGLTPTIRFPFETADATDREAALPHAPPTWRGPDVRDRAVLAHAEDGTWTVSWPPHRGNVGPCKDADLCRALRVLGSSPATGLPTYGPATARRKAPGKGR
ncbi:MAG: S41 family peptidase [Polyangiaceae bacterium]|jgi:carboxyl-terminal processing protease